MISQRRPTIKESCGNGTLIVLFDPNCPESLHLPDTLFSALDHFGMPYQVWDVSRRPLRAHELLQHRAVVIGQENFGASLGAGLQELLKAVEAGVGLINFDHDLARYGQAMRETLRVTTAKPAIRSAQTVTITQCNHFITFTCTAGESKAFRTPIPIHTAAIEGKGERVLLESEGRAALIVGRHGQGRIVQWLVSPKVWLHKFFGHAQGLDDLFWKGIVWAARKPFVMKAMPPFVRIRLDDCDGTWRDGRDFDFVNVLNEWGHTPNLGFCMRAITEDGARRIKKLFDEGKADFSPHIISPGVSLFYGDEHAEYSTSQIAELMTEMDSLLARWGIRPSRVLSDHNHMWSERVIPFLIERGITYKMNITMPGESHDSVHIDWKPAPYGLMDYALDTVPGHPEFFVVFNHHPTYGATHSYLPDGRFLFNRGGAYGETTWNFLSGLTVSTLGYNDIGAMARRYAQHMRLGLDSLFFGGVITNAHFMKDLSLAELGELLKQSDALMPRHEKIYAHYDLIAEYARSKVETHLGHVDVSESGKVSLSLVGRATVPLQVYVWRDVEDGAEHRFETIGECNAVREVTFAA